MKKVILILVLLCCMIPLVSATEVLSNYHLDVRADNSTQRFYISGFNLNYSRDFGNMNWSETITWATNESNLYEMLQSINSLQGICNSSFRVLERYGQCVIANEEWSRDTLKCDKNKDYEGMYWNCTINTTSLQSELERKIDDWYNCENDKFKLENETKTCQQNLTSTQSQKWLFGVGGIILGVGGYLIYQRRKIKQKPEGTEGYSPR